jgi:uncharacterized iron-regulated protein
MTGRVIDVRARREIAPGELVQRLLGARFVLLGEQHDNPDHHRLQAWLIAGLAEAGQRRGVAFEMLPRDVAGALDAQLADGPGGVDGIPVAVDWERLGWPAWPLYRPVFAAALAADFPVFAADLSRESLARLRAGGPAPEALAGFGLEEPLPAEALASMRDSLIRAHCGMLPAAAVDRLVTIQRARDAQLAASLVGAAGPDGSILIAGAGHAERDSGVPVYLARALPGASVLAVGLLEVDPSARDLEAVLGQSRAFDYLWMTPRVEDSDPCERFHEQLRKLHPGPATRPG